MARRRIFNEGLTGVIFCACLPIILTSMRASTCTLILAICFYTHAVTGQAQPIVRSSETYELANIILALTAYGKADQGEVNKSSMYYKEVMAYFGPYAGHPVVQEVNYSRELWDRLLSFRTDAVAFAFDEDGRLHRRHDFYSMGKKVNAFEDHLALVQDFAAQSGFRSFWRNKKPYLDSLCARYEASLIVPEVETFLSRAFRMTSKGSLQIIVSPLVGRMHCQRTFNGMSTSFINIPDYIFSAANVADISDMDLAIGVHMFLTEIDHDYVGPTSMTFKRELKRYFDPGKWDKGSGYEKYRHGTFDEYMTWAVYDLFVRERFPDVADKVTQEWHKINANRGFFASRLFGEKLTALYTERGPQEELPELYPVLIEWCGAVADRLDELVAGH